MNDEREKILEELFCMSYYKQDDWQQRAGHVLDTYVAGQIKALLLHIKSKSRYVMDDPESWYMVPAKLLKETS